MKQNYLKTMWLVLLLSLLGMAAARAQSGPYGNEWLVPGQQYYKIKVARDGIYRLNYAYLQQAGLTSADPRRLQLWRRGREVAIHVGGNATALDASSFVELFGQRNDGQLDRGMYKNAADQAHKLYSLFTDTAAYFLTVSPTTLGKRMTQPQLAAAAPHANWLGYRTEVLATSWASISEESFVYLPWMEAGEGFFSDLYGVRAKPDGTSDVYDGSFTVDSLTAIVGDPRLEMLVVGFRNTIRTVTIAVTSGTSPRQLGSFTLAGFNSTRFRTALRATDIGADGKLQLKLSTPPTPGFVGDNFVRVGYVRVTYPQTPRWATGQTGLTVLSDSTLTGALAYQPTNLPATVLGYDVTDPYSVVRVSQAANAAGQLVFPAATDGRARVLRLHDGARTLVPPLPAQQVRFRALPTTANFLVVSARGLMQPTADGTTANAVRSYAAYRASATGGKYDTLTVSTEQLYDQFHYGEKSALAIRQFAQWMLDVGGPRQRYLLLLGKGYETGTAINGRLHRRFTPAQYGGTPDYVPTSSRGASDIFFTADWQKGDYVSRMATGRIAANNPAQIMIYLSKLREHEALGLEPWRRNVLLMAGGQEPGEPEEFKGYLEEYGRIMKKPFFGGRVVRFIDRIGRLGYEPIIVDIAPQVNEGVSIISYFGHGSLRDFNLTPTNILAPASGYANKGRYPVMFMSGCVAGNAFTGLGSMGEDWMLVADKGCIGFMGNSSLDVAANIDKVDKLTYTLLLNDPQWYGKPVVEAQAEAFRRLQPVLVPGQFGIPSLMSTIWQGDPALRLFSPERPDFQTADNRLQLAPTVVPATPNAAFELKLGVSNPGKITTGALPIRVTRMVGSNTSVTNFVVPQARQDTTYTLALTNPTTGSVAGQNTFQVDIDPDNLIPELDETNNRATLSYTFLTGGVTPLSPPEFAIVGSNDVRLVAQSNVPTTSSREYDLELDTTQTFAKPLRQAKLSAVMVPEWTPALPVLPGQPDSVVWYWRVRLHTPQGDESPDWAVSSFRVIKGRTQGGWSQSHPGQFRRDERSGVEVAVPGGQWSFDENTRQATVTSTRIGPARQWETLYHTIRTGSETGYTLKLLGIDSLGTTTVLNPNVTSRTLALSSVSAKLYRYLQLQATLTTDNPGQTPQLEQWLVTYQGVPEGVVRPSATPLTAAQLTDQAQKTGLVTVPVSFQNVSDFDFKAPLVGYIVLRSGTAGAPRERYYPLQGPALLAHTQQTYSVALDARGLYGTLSGQVVLNPRRQPEQNYFNNELTLAPFEVVNNDTPPVLDVAFDGRHLLNGEIVSPRPSISVQLRDLDKLRPVTGRGNFLLVLTPRGKPSQAIDLNGGSITSFKVDSAQGLARMVFEPGKSQPLADNVYTLEVQGKDGSGNPAGTEPYRITFEVVSGSSITNVFPYPNPVTSKTRFVFTLTGEVMPRNMKIQIVSLTGRVVKEIMMEEMGPLRIGNNITEQYWDGTDTYGDRLANGTYLYRVVLDDPTGAFKQRTTAADKAFKKDWGKLVLLR
ncbi:putative type IX secretion system sortase PorU2 [Hymenobacter psychrophilus]|uniref:CARDB protein n=1 Tax=Hymenobacter psychrophilus TaxID=651662 RepID=A0A1H3AVX8_9BACT|nr:C25 family cysteine peptidase [Hymenobacter psychrophilus]SDX33882.1 CARDB protein [Hymenobacter psychrophilus]